MAKILVACETSGVVRRAFAALGHDVRSCDLLPSEDGSSLHHIGDARAYAETQSWDLVIAHPPCTYLCSSGQHWNRRKPERQAHVEEAAEFFMYWTRFSRYCIENPIGIMSTRYRKPDQIVQPYYYGHDASKSTCLWLQGVPKLQPVLYVHPRIVAGKKRWGNQTDSGQNKLAPSPYRWKERSRTYEGIAYAMAKQWTASLEVEAMRGRVR